MNNNLIAVTIGDIKGIGIEIIFKLWKNHKIKNFVVFSDYKYVNKKAKEFKCSKKINIINKKNSFEYKKNKFNIYNFQSSNSTINILNSINYAYKECKLNNFIGMITLPIRKDKIIINLDKKFTGHTEYFERLDKVKYSNMILKINNLIVSTMTTHIPIKDINKVINKKNFIYNKIVALNKSLKIDFNIKDPKILVSGINPHAGENGKIGIEEKKLLIPSIRKCQKNKINVDGPNSADSMLNKINIKKYDCFLFIFHDQALITYKYISQFTGINYTSNLSVIRVSPDHGTAYNLVGTNKFNMKSIMNCFKAVNNINKNRKNNELTKKIIRAKLS